MAADKYEALRGEVARGRILLPGDEGFEESLERWSLTCVKPAAAVAQPATAEEVSAVVKFATANGIAFNVKGGGHSTSPVSSAPSPEGMVLDLALMRDVSVDAAAQTVSFGGGCLWSDVDDALWSHGLATVGGTVSHTGVGGLILHGGYGVLTGRRGMALDILLSCEVVLADGRIVTASETENPDLFWGLRGAGSSFGVVTKFTSKVFPQGDIWGGMIVLALDHLPAVVDFVNHWAETTDGYQSFVAAFAYAPPAPGADPKAPRPPVLFLNVIHTGPDAETAGPEYYAPLLKLEALLQQVGPMPYPAINKGADDIFCSGKRYLFGGSNFTTPLKLSAAEACRDGFFNAVGATPGGQDGVCMFECFSSSVSAQVPADATAFNSRGNYFNIGTIWTWDEASSDLKIRDQNRAFQKIIREFGYNDMEFKDGVGRYVNYDGDTLTAKSAFGSNVQRLRELKEKYDPQNVFDKMWKLGIKAESK
ncbi:hypothetical protein B0J13DRAFT_190671 [Dactylonectria estremocensis]|uniref:FAD-binding PCMH-type domain-containing protein n=1 Tax=Dactylonectria estremocensis TaxID=1079267 RepID=A0A9P9FCH9_9HYPO|nr:hypothetical protein B0J13DRAFT_190671 [Dactylonectria estremocensis]